MRYTDDRKAEVVAVYVEEGLPAAHRFTKTDDKPAGIPKTTIVRWAQAAGLDPAEVTQRNADQTKAANAARILLMESKRVTLREALVDKALDMLARMDEPQIDYRGRHVEEVRWEKATAQACQQYATATAILIDKLRLELGEETDRIGRVPWDPEVAKQVARVEGEKVAPLRVVS